MITEGSRLCVDYALEFGAAANIAGGHIMHSEIRVKDFVFSMI